ncbi:platelet glycoprotein IX isoform X1 [Phascolarctos cinereus]|uniref:Platelet glycoprotein IX isoform X1 n=2 Tax=Phascolarctos cinereus TaxID=38626 RepID=A0A6P5JY15_PHACI|nr:platelet glycoprotein IX isoform X1 [Phascolarctos cinereus]
MAGGGGERALTTEIPLFLFFQDKGKRCDQQGDSCLGPLSPELLMAPERKESRKASQMPMPIAIKWMLLLLWGLPASLACPLPCDCQTLEAFGLVVDCSNRGLTTVPALPNTTRQLYLQNNNLSSIPAGTFDHLSYVYRIDVTNNPWHCDCGILYLKLWLEDHAQETLHLTRCASPAVTASLSLDQLTGNELEGCRRQLYPDQYHVFFWGDLALIVLTILNIILLGTLLWMAQKTIYWVTLNQCPQEPHQWQESSLRHHKAK